MKRSEKVIFLLVVVVVAFFAREVFPSIVVAPQSATADQSLSSATTSSAPLVALPQTTAVNNPSNVEPTMPQVETVSPTSTSLPKFASKAYMVADLTTGSVLLGSNTANRWPTASLTKLMTATIIFDSVPTSTQITITPQMFSADPTEQNLVVGGTYTVEDLLHLLLMPSSNVAAEALADYVGHATFMAEMNARAQSWGMKDTYFDDPSGISAANESTANDLLILAQHVYNDYPGIFEITNTPVTTITELNSGKAITVHSINIFAGEPVFVGGKTGNTPQAGGNLLSIFTYQGKPVFITVLGAPALPFQDTSMLFTWFKTNYK
jgi:D-alanyl-D-alanine carboxypeptidase